MRLTGLLLIPVLLVACSRNGGQTVLEFWAMGREGEVVQSLVPEFERRNPAIRVKVQQIPWSAAHEKLLTAYAGEAMPDVFQLGNTWIPEFVVLQAIVNLDDRLPAVQRRDYFEGILETNHIDRELYGLPWYVDTRLLFYRTDILAEAGFSMPPRTWSEWLEAMAAVKALPGGERYALLLPMNEWQAPTILGFQLGAELLRNDARFGNFQSDAFRRAFHFYLDLFRQGYAPAVSEAQIANLYQAFGSGYFAMYVTGPWNIGEFEHRLPKALRDRWATAPMPAPDENYPGLSLAGGASLAISRHSDHKDQAWKLIEFLSEPEQQVAFYRLTGDLPARRSAWQHPDLASETRAQAFKVQLERVVYTPKIPEWERIAGKIAHYAEKAVRGELTEDRALAALDQDVDHILEKRRWLLRKQAR
ncbi:putative sugar ABC transporter, sugar-binding protein [Methylocaldum marinum]|uniref:Putative sugar ABC transporter, sugar-binding protein n=1 Tax=Methylocaldum marinum TaxID=1432792 RepID=A0A250KR63_9GAMM|nr:sugar ABC transporter substrate-binding protein [Methylocaldum marinum]BBA34118.1 putative sugar ABC transporter, sugar-binding protein [Methylocaldum marinum]